MNAQHRTMASILRILAGVAVAGMTGCAQPVMQTTCFGTYQNGVSREAVALDYPEPAATGIDPALGVLVLSSSRAVPVQLVPIVAGVAQSAIPLAPAAVPVPLPTPIATPIPGAGVAYFAVSVPQLTPATTYRVLASTTEADVGCVGAIARGALEDAGQFTTL